MRKTNLRFLLIAIFYCMLAYSQEISEVSAPNAASIMTAGNVPVSLHTGIPNISIPLYSMPTKSKTINLDLGLNYHPFSVGINSNVGSGWSLPFQACIYRETKEEDKDTDEGIYYNRRQMASSNGTAIPNEYKGTNIFQVNALGFSARFYIGFYGTQMRINRLDLSGGDIRIDPSYDPDTFEIFSFIIYDGEGNKYVFDKANKFYINRFLQGCSYARKTVWYLSKVYDCNNYEILSYHYRQNSTSSSCGTVVGEPKLDSISAKDVGVLQFEQSSTSRLLRKIKIKDSHSNELQSINFEYIGIPQRSLLSKITIKNPTDIKELKYSLGYKDILGALDVSRFKLDGYGFYQDKICEPDPNDAGNPYYRTIGLLEYITYPTGGSTKYEFEANTYYNEDEYEDEMYTNLYHNNTVTLEKSTENQLGFLAMTGGYYYIKFYGVFAGPVPGSNEHQEIIDLEGNQNNSCHMNFERLAPGLDWNDTNFSNYPATFNESEKTQNYCDGKKIYLSGGYYRLRCPSNPNARILWEVRKRTPNPIVNKWFYDDGVRIKSITQLDNVLNEYGDQNVIKKVNYTYNIFSDEHKSSGNFNGNNSLSTFYPISEGARINYKNVTVYETGKGRVEHTFLVMKDFEFQQTASYIPYSFWRDGLEAKKETFNEQGHILQTIENQFEYATTGISLPNLSSSDPFDEISYGTDGYVNKLISTAENYYYKHGGETLSKKIKTITSFFSKSLLDFSIIKYDEISTGDKTQIIYQAYPAYPEIGFFNLKPKEVHTYKNGTLIGKKIFEASQFPGNFKYLSSRTLNQKGNNQPEADFTATKYDQFDNLLEGHTENGITTSVIYGYNKTKVIAKIANASYTQIAAALNKTEAQVLELTESNITEIDSLRTQLPLANVTTYTHIPLVGVSTIKDARGKVTSYSYDSFGRLAQVKDDSGAILTENTYNYQPSQE
jgi:YD repeat-containing protein